MTFAAAFAKGGCVTTGDAGAIEQAADGLVAQLAGGGTTTTTATTSTTTTTAPSPLTVTVGPGGNLGFDPATLTITVGDTVHWVWASAPHNVVSGTAGAADGKFCSPSDTNCATAPLMEAGTTYDHTFTQAGTFPYFCAAHFNLGMVGTIVVQP
jgi:plastocyanin